MKKTLSILLAVLLITALVPVASADSNPSFTLMVYMCGTDLESDGGCATDDLKEMIASGVKDSGNVRVYVETGGTKKWSTKGMTAKVGERWTLSKAGLNRLESLGKVDMGDAATFTAFLQYGFEHFPADRYGLVFWDHGAGASSGVCFDEITNNSLNMAEIYSSLKTAATGQRFSFIGFDACLMADYEMALHLQPFADYMVASEETEPGEGWNYKSWLSALVKDPGADMEVIGAKIVDSFITSINNAGYGDFGTLSVLNLNKMGALRSAVETMGEKLKGEIDGGNFNTISRIRQNVRSFGETSDAASDMIDLSVFADIFGRYDAQGAAALRKALADVVVHNGYTSNLSQISGLAILVPYSTRADAAVYLEAYDTQNLMPKYTGFVRSLAESIDGGSYTFGSTSVTQQSVQDATVDWFSQYATDPQTYYDTYNNLWGDQSAASTEGQSFSLDGFLNSLFSGDSESFNSEAYSANNLWDATSDTSANAVSSADFSNLWGDQTQTGTQTGAEPSTVEITSGNETYSVDNPFASAGGDYAYTLSMTKDEMQYLATANACLMMDVSEPDFECYVDLGYTQDVIVDWNQSKLYGLFDGTWPTLGGQVVCIYDQIANEKYVRSLIPVTLNGDETYLLVVFDEKNPGGVVVGYTEGYTDEGLPVRGYDELKEGDIVIPEYELIYWDENDVEQSEPFYGDPITVGSKGTIDFGYDDVEAQANYMYGFCLNDVFGGYQYSDFITLSF